MWQCPECDYICQADSVLCERCFHRYDTFRLVTKPGLDLDSLSYDIEHNVFLLRCNRLDYLIGIKNRENPMSMNPQEELFASFFNDEKVQVKDLKDFELQQRREELAQIAHEARARLTAVDEEQRGRKAAKAVRVFVNNDELTSNAINSLTERNIKLSKREKMISNLMSKTGVDRATAEAMVPADSSKGNAINSRAKLEAVNKGIAIKTEREEAASKPFVNPFAPKPEPAVEVQIIPETDTIIVTKTEETKPQTNQLENLQAPKFVNPFAK